VHEKPTVNSLQSRLGEEKKAKKDNAETQRTQRFVEAETKELGIGHGRKGDRLRE
jgi:hypothetical protein